VAIILIALPLLMFAVLGNAAADTGDAIAAGLTPVLHDLRPAEIAALRRELSRFAANERSIKIMLRPTSATAAQSFYFVAIDPPIAAATACPGYPPGLSQGCSARLLRGRNASLLSDGSEALIAVKSMDGVAGCWAIVIATAESRVLGAIEPLPYLARKEVRVAIAIYLLMALLIAAIFAGVWRGLLGFRRLALSPTSEARFAMTTDVPELSSLAAAFDGMVRPMKRSAEMLRQAAEDNAHAFKGPIGTIRQAIEPPLQNGASHDVAMRISLRTVSSALDRLDGLVRSARYLDSAAAELLEPHQLRDDEPRSPGAAGKPCR
jgi:two-component system sensor histidine kinase ChvG